jgi:hypothetical protein
LNAPGLAERLHDAEEVFLPCILDLRGRAQPRTQLDREQIPEVAREVTLGVRVSRSKSIEVLTVELKSPFALHASKSYARRLPTRKAPLPNHVQLARAIGAFASSEHSAIMRNGRNDTWHS